MSSTDLLNGPVSSLPDYNVKNNCSIFCYNTVSKINVLRSYLLAIAYQRLFIDIVTDLKNLGRDYYNKNPRKFCSTVSLGAVQGFGGKSITVYLPPPGGVIDNSIEYVDPNYVTSTWLMRVLQNQKLPTCWSQKIKDGFVCISDAVPVDQMSNNEKILYYYIKNENFFNRVSRLMVQSFRVHSEQIYLCYTLVFPAELYPGTKAERTFTVTNDFLKAVYSQYLRASRLPSPYRLPAPQNITPDYNVPASNLTYGQLTQYMNNNSDSFTI